MKFLQIDSLPPRIKIFKSSCHPLSRVKRLICKYTYIQMNNYAENKLDIFVLMFDFNGAICGIYPSFPLKNIK